MFWYESRLPQVSQFIIAVQSTVYCKSFEVEKFCGFFGSIGKRETFTVKNFQLILKMVGHGPGSSLKNFCDLLSTLGKVSGMMLPSQNYYRILQIVHGGKLSCFSRFL